MAMAGNKHHDPNDHPQCQNRLLSDYYIMGFSCSTSGLRGPRIWLMVCMANVWTSRDFPVPVVVEWPGEDLPNTFTPWRWGSSRSENYCHLKFGHVQGLCFGMMIFVDHWVKHDLGELVSNFQQSPFPTSACLDLPCVPCLFPTFVLLDAHSLYIYIYIFTGVTLFTTCSPLYFWVVAGFQTMLESFQKYTVYKNIYIYTSQCIIYIYLFIQCIYIYMWKSHVCLYMFIHVLSGYRGFPKTYIN